MNKLIIKIATVLALTTSGMAMAQDFYDDPGKKAQHQRQDQRRHQGMQSMPAVDQLMRALRRVGLTDEQKAGIKVIMKDMKEEIRPIMMETKNGHGQLKELIKAKDFDENAVAAIADKEGQLAAEQTKIVSRSLAKIYAQLSDEQRLELEAMAAERKGRHGKNREPRSEDV